MTDFKPIIPMRKRCECGKPVKNHHWLCDKCWGKKAKREYFKKTKRLCKPPKKKMKETWVDKYEKFISK